MEPTSFSSNIRLILSSCDDSICFHIRGPLHEPFFFCNSNLIENWFQCNSVVGYVNAIKFSTWHDSTAVMACAKFDSDHFNTSGMSTEWNFYWIWIAMDPWPTFLCFSSVYHSLQCTVQENKSKDIHCINSATHMAVLSWQSTGTLTPGCLKKNSVLHAWFWDHLVLQTILAFLSSRTHRDHHSKAFFCIGMTSLSSKNFDSESKTVMLM